MRANGNTKSARNVPSKTRIGCVKHCQFHMPNTFSMQESARRCRLEEADVPIQKTAQESEVCRRLDAIPGIRPLTAIALIAANREWRSLS